MKFPLLILVGLLITFGCNQTSKKEEKLLKNIDHWISANSSDRTTKSYWVKDADKDHFKRIDAKDTLSYQKYLYSQRYEFPLQEDLRFKKIIMVEAQGPDKFSETDIYYKKREGNLETSLSISYQYNKAKYRANYTDVMVSPLGRQENLAKIDSLVAKAHAEGYWYCGTDLQDSIWGTTPYLPIPREISLDSALLILKEWTN